MRVSYSLRHSVQTRCQCINTEKFFFRSWTIYRLNGLIGRWPRGQAQGRGRRKTGRCSRTSGTDRCAAGQGQLQPDGRALPAFCCRALHCTCTGVEPTLPYSWHYTERHRHLPGAPGINSSSVTPWPLPWHLLVRAIANVRRFARCKSLWSWWRPQSTRALTRCRPDAGECWSRKQHHAGFARRCRRSGCCSGTPIVSNALEYSACRRRSGILSKCRPGLLLSRSRVPLHGLFLFVVGLICSLARSFLLPSRSLLLVARFHLPE